MKILYLTPYLPAPGSHGCASKNWDDLESLSKQHTIHLVCFVSAADIPKLSALRNLQNVIVYPVHIDSYRRFPLHSPQCSGLIVDLCSRNVVDIIQCECSFMARYLPKRPGVPAILTEHQVYWLHFWREFKNSGNLLYIVRLIKNVIDEKIWLKKFDRILFFSEHDRDLFYFLLDRKSKSRIIPLSVDEKYYVPPETSEVTYDLSFLGNFNSLANVDAIEYFIKEVEPLLRKLRPKTTILIIGSGVPEELKRKASLVITFSGQVADVRSYIALSKVFINPMRLGSGMRRKLLEAMAMAKPVVSSSIGSEGLTAREGESIILADKPNDFAQAVIDLLAAPERMASLGNAARAYVERSHSREKIAASLEQIYKELVSN